MLKTNPVRVMTKARTRHGRVYPAVATEYSVFVGKGNIQIYKDDNMMKDIPCRYFEVGDEAEYDSYNLHYTGTITKITDKCVTIESWPGTRYAETHRLDLNTFCWRNYKFNAAKTAAYNAEESMYI